MVKGRNRGRATFRPRTISVYSRTRDSPLYNVHGYTATKKNAEAVVQKIRDHGYEAYYREKSPGWTNLKANQKYMIYWR